jgi:adenylate cyclase
MKIPFRMTLLSLLLTMVGVTVLLIGSLSHRQALFTADDLVTQYLDQTAERVDLEISDLLARADRLREATELHLGRGDVGAGRFDDLVPHIHEALTISEGVTGYFIGLESTGEAAGVTSISGSPVVWRSRLVPEGGAYAVREYPLGDPPRASASVPEGSGPDIRTRPWYDQARRAGRPVWTEAFVFLGVEGARDRFGVTYASPVFRDGRLVAVLDADFEFRGLCRFLQSLELPRGGIAFVVERRPDGTERVIAHPRADLVTGGGASTRDLLTPREFPDPRVASLFTSPERRTRWRHYTRFSAEGRPHLGAVRQLRGESRPRWTICVVLPEAEILGRVQQGFHRTLLIGGAILAAAVLASFWLSAQVSRPLERIGRVAAEVGRLEIAPRPAVESFVLEVDRLGAAIEDMKGGLRSFGKFVPRSLVQAYLGSRSEARFGGERRRVTIFFSDIVGFTAISEDLDPERLVELLREYLNTLSREIEGAGGTVDKYIGDAIMAFWGAPAHDPGHAASACVAALRCQAALRSLNAAWEAAGRAPFRTRIGLHTGEVVVGNIGSDSRLNYTVIGDAVNLASRMEGLNTHYGTGILISESTYQSAGAEVFARPIDYVAVKGRRDPVLVYEPLGTMADVTDADRRLADIFERALALYRGADFAGAIALLEEVLIERPDDPPARSFILRCRSYLDHPPGPGWDGVHRRETK